MEREREGKGDGEAVVERGETLTLLSREDEKGRYQSPSFLLSSDGCDDVHTFLTDASEERVALHKESEGKGRLREGL